MQVMFINNDGGGFADMIAVNEGATISDLFTQRMPHCMPEDYLIRINRQPATSEQRLQEGDRVSITPTKIHGANYAA